jgi:hypothetical protein
MDWVEKDTETRKVSHADQERTRLLNMVKAEALPTVKKEEENGAPEFKPVEFQPVKSPGVYEAEFGVKNKDIVFHFWPYGHAQAFRDNKAAPKFKPEFRAKLKEVMGSVFEARRLDISDDKDVGAVSVKALGWGESQYARELSIDACTKLHLQLGGTLDS